MKLQRTAEALLITLLEKPLWFLLFAAVWAFTWFITVIALAIGLATLGTWAPPTIGESFKHVLHAPKNILLES